MERLRNALNEIVDVSDHVLDVLFALPRGIPVQKSDEFRSLFVEFLLKQLLHGLILQDGLLGFVADAEAGFHVDQIEIPTDHLHGKGVEGADIGLVHGV